MTRQRRHQLRYPERQAARVAAQLALAAGRIERRPCEICGAEPAEMHHDDYSQPLAVRFLCKLHHREADKAAARPRYTRPRSSKGQDKQPSFRPRLRSSLGQRLESVHVVLGVSKQKICEEGLDAWLAQWEATFPREFAAGERLQPTAMTRAAVVDVYTRATKRGAP